MIAQFLAIKDEHPDYLLFYRMGDFYELFFQDALDAAQALDITLTHRGQHLGKRVPMCGVPFHAAETYLQRLIKKGFKVAVCEQTEDPVEAKKRGSKAVVRREIVRLVTAGTLTEDTLLEARAHNYLAAIGMIGGAARKISADDKQSDNKAELALAWLDISTGDLHIMDGTANILTAQLAALMPREVLLPERLDARLQARFDEVCAGASITPLATAQTGTMQGTRALTQAYGVDTLDAFGTFSRPALTAAGMLAIYVELTQMGKYPQLKPPKYVSSAGHMRLDSATRSNLELTQALGGNRQGSLLSAIDLTQSGAGARLLAARLSAPSTDIKEITARHLAITYFADPAQPRTQLRADIRAHLRRLPDMARALARLSLARGGPRDLAAIRDGIKTAFAISQKQADYMHAQPIERTDERRADLLGELDEAFLAIQPSLATLADLAAHLDKALAAELPHLARDGGFIATGYKAELDATHDIRNERRRHIAGLQAEYIKATAIKALKVKHNALLGYYVDVPSMHGDKLMRPPHNETFIHRQTLANSVRFSPKKLAQFAGDISRADERALGLELAIFDQLSKETLEAAAALSSAAEALAVIDIATAQAELATSRQWIRPRMFEDVRFIVKRGRHPVVEAALAARQDAPFVANDCLLNAEASQAEVQIEGQIEEQNNEAQSKDSCRLILLTGPNMAGKSTYLRQNALLAILAQAGFFVPAERAEIGIIDQVFSRVGAADDLARGRSTFMVEMVETAAILNQATKASLVILDEIGRGTATFDGLSIAWACVEHVHNVTQCRALFATHYHELTALSDHLAGLANATMRVKEYQGEVIFLHEVGPGAADRSYGIHVAELAGLPRAVLARAREVLGFLETSRSTSASAGDGLGVLPLFTQTTQPTNDETQASFADDKLRQALRDIDPDRLSPREALTTLYHLQKILIESDK